MEPIDVDIEWIYPTLDNSEAIEDFSHKYDKIFIIIIQNLFSSKWEV